MNNNHSQNEIIEKHLLTGDSINCHQAAEYYNIYALPQRIAYLRNKGYIIPDIDNGQKYSDYCIPIKKKYAIYNRCNKQILKRIDLNKQVFVWTNSIDDALPLRAKLFDICQYLKKIEKYKIEVIEIN